MNMKKKILTIFIIACMALMLCACSKLKNTLPPLPTPRTESPEPTADAFAEPAGSADIFASPLPAAEAMPGPTSSPKPAETISARPGEPVSGTSETVSPVPGR